MSQAARSAARRKEWRDVNGLACGSPNRGPLAPRSWDDGERSWIPEGARRRGPCARMRGVSAGSGPVHVRLSHRDCRPSAAGAKHGHAEEADAQADTAGHSCAAVRHVRAAPAHMSLPRPDTSLRVGRRCPLSGPARGVLDAAVEGYAETIRPTPGAAEAERARAEQDAELVNQLTEALTLHPAAVRRASHRPACALSYRHSRRLRLWSRAHRGLPACQ